MTSNLIGRKVNASVALLSKQLEALIQSVRELNGRRSSRMIEENMMTERWKLSSQRSEIQNFVNFVNVKFLVERYNLLNDFRVCFDGLVEHIRR